ANKKLETCRKEVKISKAEKYYYLLTKFSYELLMDLVKEPLKGKKKEVNVKKLMKDTNTSVLLAVNKEISGLMHNYPSLFEGKYQEFEEITHKMLGDFLKCI